MVPGTADRDQLNHRCSTKKRSLQASARTLLDDYGSLAEVVNQWDRWPNDPTMRSVAVAVVDPIGTVRSFLNDTIEGSLVPADPVEPLTPQAVADVEAMKRRARVDRFAPVGGRPLTVNFRNVNVCQRPDASPVPEASVLIPYEHMEPEVSPERSDAQMTYPGTTRDISTPCVMACQTTTHQ